VSVTGFIYSLILIEDLKEDNMSKQVIRINQSCDKIKPTPIKEKNDSISHFSFFLPDLFDSFEAFQINVALFAFELCAAPSLAS
jgi:hypothetical protein